MSDLGINIKINNIDKVLKRIDKISNDLPHLCQLFIHRLASEGIKVGSLNTGEYGEYITFEIEVKEPTKKCCKGLLIVRSKSEITREWVVKGGEVREETINPLLMAEFGSGHYANSGWSQEIQGVGQGTLNKYGHAYDINGWWWKDLEGVKHHSYGESPSYPVYSAYAEMKLKIDEIAKEVFRL